MTDWIDRLFFCIIGSILLVGATMLGLLFFDGYKEMRAAPAIIACRAQGLEGERLPFRTTVTCVPVAGHSIDTLYIKTEAK